MSNKPKILHRTLVASSRLFRIETVALRFGNGVEVNFERLAPGGGSGAVLIVPIANDDTLLLIREYAAGTERYELGLPKGRVERGEDPLAAAERELREEVGYAARRLIPLRTMSISPGYFAHQTQLVLARDLYASPLPGDEPEAIEVVRWPLEDLPGLLAQDDLTEARSIAALFLARDHLLNQRGNDDAGR